MYNKKVGVSSHVEQDMVSLRPIPNDVKMPIYIKIFTKWCMLYYHLDKN